MEDILNAIGIKRPDPSDYNAIIIRMIFVFFLTSISIVSIFCLYLLFHLYMGAISGGVSEHEYGRTFLLGLAAIFGMPFLIWRTYVAHVQSSAARNQANIALESHFTGIFTKAVELLGTLREIKSNDSNGTAITNSLPNIESRLGAIYALERLIKESVKDRRTILETLCAYVRENSPLTLDDAHRSDFQNGEWSPANITRTDIQAALNVIGRRSVLCRSDKEIIDLSNSNLSNYKFFQLDFTGALFINSSLSHCTISQSNFDRCTFRRTSLRKITIYDSSFTFANFMESPIDLSFIDGINLSNGRILGSNLLEAWVNSCDISDANLEGEFSVYDHLKTEEAFRSDETQSWLDSIRSFISDNKGTPIIDVRLTSALDGVFIEALDDEIPF